MNEKVTLSFYCPATMKRDLEAIAEAQERSVSSLIRRLVWPTVREWQSQQDTTQAAEPEIAQLREMQP